MFILELKTIRKISNPVKLQTASLLSQCYTPIELEVLTHIKEWYCPKFKQSYLLYFETLCYGIHVNMCIRLLN